MFQGALRATGVPVERCCVHGGIALYMRGQPSANHAGCGGINAATGIRGSNLGVSAALDMLATVPTSSSRHKDFLNIRNALGPAVVGEIGNALISHGDSLDLLGSIPAGSVSLIVTDPPYHSTKKGNIYGDRAFEEDENFLEWMEKYTIQWKRVLKTNGTLYVFCSSEMSARLEVMMSQYFRPINHVTWSKPNEPGYDGWKGKMKKESLRQWYPHSERILVFEHGSYGSRTATRRAPLGQFLLDTRRQSGMTMKDLTEAVGAYGKVNHGGAVANWEAGRNIPSREQYAKIVSTLEATGKIAPMPPYEDVVRPMNINGDIEFTDTWDFMSVRPFAGKHPAEKPQDMLMHIISASSYLNDIVLDCFAGSGSTAIAALRLGRKSVSIEIEEQWVDRICKEVRAFNPDTPYEPIKRRHHMKKNRELQINRLFD